MIGNKIYVYRPIWRHTGAYGDITPITENQVEKKMDSEVEIEPRSLQRLLDFNFNPLECADVASDLRSGQTPSLKAAALLLLILLL